MLIDWGATGRPYKSDLTRVLVTGKVTPKFEKIYRTVLAAQERGIAAIRPGVTARDVDAEARSVIEEAGFGRFFDHGLGHGLGMDIHEAPRLRKESEVILQPGMVVTVEPGIYLPDWGGIRIEDDVLVTPDGCEVLTHVPKSLDSVRSLSRDPASRAIRGDRIVAGAGCLPASHGHDRDGSVASRGVEGMAENPPDPTEPLDVQTIHYLVRLMKRYDLTAIDLSDGRDPDPPAARGPEPPSPPAAARTPPAGSARRRRSAAAAPAGRARRRRPRPAAETSSSRARWSAPSTPPAPPTPRRSSRSARSSSPTRPSASSRR